MRTSPDPALRVIAIFKYIQAALLLVLAFGLLHFLHRNLAETAERWLQRFRVDPHNKYAAGLLIQAGLVTPRRLEEFSGITFAYAALFLTEGTGLILNRAWAEGLTIVATGSLIPVEVYECFHHFRVVKLVLLILNVAIVWYLIARIVARKKAEKNAPVPSPSAD